MSAFVTLAILVVLYLIPAIVAQFREKRNAGAILALNILLGWTGLGWALALIWAVTVDAEVVR
jgi:hypothetical protein